MLDYLIIGQGLAGTIFGEILQRQGKAFRIMSETSQNASGVAAGLYNPVVLKRFTPVWKGEELLRMALPFYSRLEEKLHCTLNHKFRLFRRFTSAAEHNLWFEATARPELANLLSDRILNIDNPCLIAPHGYGEVNGTGRIDTKLLLESCSRNWANDGILIMDRFRYDELEILQDHIQYGELKARRIVLATGFGMKNDPIFGYLPMQGSKGELLRVRIPGLKATYAIKGPVFIIPVGQDCYSIGATYNWRDLQPEPTENARHELVSKLESFLSCPYEILDHKAGIRPTVADRRPLVGRHPAHKPVYLLNGLGSRGVMMAPYLATRLYQLIEHKESLPREMDIARFQDRFPSF